MGRRRAGRWDKILSGLLAQVGAVYRTRWIRQGQLPRGRHWPEGCKTLTGPAATVPTTHLGCFETAGNRLDPQRQRFDRRRRALARAGAGAGHRRPATATQLVEFVGDQKRGH